ncbi:MAG: hypothetical protein AAF499_16930, partial [Pseudomonadota bacterium]
MTSRFTLGLTYALLATTLTGFTLLGGQATANENETAQNASGISNRIVNGQVSAVGQFPFAAAI